MKVTLLQSHVVLHFTCAPVTHLLLQTPKDLKGIKKSKGGRPRKGAKYNVSVVAWVSAAVFRVVLIVLWFSLAPFLLASKVRPSKDYVAIAPKTGIFLYMLPSALA